MNRDKLKKLYWRFLNLFPRKWALKLNLAFRCLFEDWDFAVNAYLFSSEFAELKEDEIRQRLSGLDENSIAVALEYVRRCRNLEQMKGYPFSDGSSSLLLRKNLKSEIMCVPDAPPELKSYQKKYGFKTGAEVLIYRHGLAFWQDKVSAYLRNKVFIDAGACIGELEPCLLEYEPSGIYAFEPSKKNVRLFEKEMKKRRIGPEQVQIVPVGLGNENCCMHFSDCGGSGQKMDSTGADSCTIVPLDEFAADNHISGIGLLKSDVEGMGLQLCRGAISVIKRDRPVLLLAAYHSRDELLGQYEYLHKELSDYHFELRDLPAGSCFEVTLIGIPGEVKNKK